MSCGSLKLEVWLYENAGKMMGKHPSYGFSSMNMMGKMLGKMLGKKQKTHPSIIR